MKTLHKREARVNQTSLIALAFRISMIFNPFPHKGPSNQPLKNAPHDIPS